MVCPHSCHRISELPPRTRRIHTPHANASRSNGTTSAYAENTQPQATRRNSLWNYLRVRGEYWGIGLGVVLLRELPPRTRRIHLVDRLERAEGGTTSAYAENTHQTTFPVAGTRNYLRVRGEYPHLIGGGIFVVELPPRTRRIPVGEDVGFRPHGTTSAYAENTHLCAHRG